jgi:Aspartyl/Asparaginyl beta-hydroxylase
MWLLTTIYCRRGACLRTASGTHHHRHHKCSFTTKSTSATPTVVAMGESKTTEPDSGTTTLNQETNDTSIRSNEDRPAIAEIHKGPAILLTSHSIRSRPQPNLLYVPGLRSLPFWTQQQLKQHPHKEDRIEEHMINRVAYGDPTIAAVVEHFDRHYGTIWQEYLSNYCNDTNLKTTYVNSKSNNETATQSDYIQPIDIMSNDNVDTSGDNERDMHLLNKGGKWDWHSYMTKGNVIASLSTQSKSSSFHQLFPQTTSILEELRSKTSTNPLLRNQLLEHVPFGYVFFSTLHEQTHILPHTSPINFRLRIHLPLYIPEQIPHENRRENKPTCGIRVGNTIREWHTGNSLVLDDSYEHEVWNDHQYVARAPTGMTMPSSHHQNYHSFNQRVILLVDIWHPDVTHDEREEICYMFQTAKDRGWLST